MQSKNSLHYACKETTTLENMLMKSYPSPIRNTLILFVVNLPEDAGLFPKIAENDASDTKAFPEAEGEISPAEVNELVSKKVP